ncbi:translesion error-prone DNA polymerase V autoproteolytic subunit [Azoarcus communis]|nr:translesion error-prone DNA polymerase V autoproteolytic subunit [Parazoarcus communis]
MFIPIGATPVSAGFPSPAEDYAQRRLDINEYLIRNPVSTFFFTVKGDSMQEADIFEGDILVVDRSIEPAHGHIVVAFLNGERLVKRLSIRDGNVSLLAGNSEYPALTLKGENQLDIWGVAIGKFKRIPA